MIQIRAYIYKLVLNNYRMARKSNKQKLEEFSNWPIMTVEAIENSRDNSGMYEYQRTSGREFGYTLFWSSRRGGVWVKA